MRYYFVAGEVSGDLHASNLIKELKRVDADAKFRGFGGDKMTEQGAEITKHYREMSFMGFVEVLMNIRTIFSQFDFCKKDILEWKPDVMILVDYPGFNLRVARWGKENGFKVFYYISPKVWAWKASRVKTIKKNVDHMFCILPFEKEFYQRYNYEVDFVGHPLLDEIKGKRDLGPGTREEEKIIALLPGSRKQEIKSILPEMLKMQKHFPDFSFVIAGVEHLGENFYKEISAPQILTRLSPPAGGGPGVRLLFNRTYELLQQSSFALVTSGTATLETALFNIPQIVCYKGNMISVAIARRIVNIKYISLVNLIMDKPVVNELIQHNLNEENLLAELNRLIKNSQQREQMLNDYREMKMKLGGEGASKRAAELMVKYLLGTNNESKQISE